MFQYEYNIFWFIYKNVFLNAISKFVWKHPALSSFSIAFCKLKKITIGYFPPYSHLKKSSRFLKCGCDCGCDRCDGCDGCNTSDGCDGCDDCDGCNCDDCKLYNFKFVEYISFLRSFICLV